MCKICGVQNIHKIDVFSDKYAEKIVDLILKKEITTNDLNLALYKKSSKLLSDAVFKGFGKPNNDKEKSLLKKLVLSVYPFAAAKQYQFIRMASKQKKDKAIETFKLFYIDYLSTEVDSAEHQAISARDWLEIENWNAS